MADEAQIRSSLQIDIGNLEYRSNPTAFTADVSGSIGPTPGAFSVAVTGTDVNLSELTTPGLARIMNLDTTNYVSYGAWDGSSIFFPLGELLPGESFILRLSRDLGKEFGTGTGTTGAPNNTFRFKADTAAVICIVEAFEK